MQSIKKQCKILRHSLTLPKAVEKSKSHYGNFHNSRYHNYTIFTEPYCIPPPHEQSFINVSDNFMTTIVRHIRVEPLTFNQ